MADFLKGRLERRFEGRVVILLERFLRDEERDDFPFRDLDTGKTGDRFGVNETEMQLIILDRQPELIAHELDVALDRLLRHLQLAASFRQLGNFRACNCACSCIMRASGGRENCSPPARFPRARFERAWVSYRTYHVQHISPRRRPSKRNRSGACKKVIWSDTFCPNACDMVLASVPKSRSSSSYQ